MALGCSPNNSAPVVCTLAAELFCREGTGINETHFISEVECEWTNGYSFEFSLLLSVFLGWLGLDRLYLGYPGLALAKFCTLGGIFLWQLIDIILIAMQVVRPADGSQYVVSYFGPRLTRLALNNDTQILAQDDW
ncbi:TM2 domain-containing protein [Tropilaelaps mercedesae]|uniref:TM2 domain-containing protein n=1 Tax=Tropilaelaps mercedesae TaxID=418985 RepID=A0A1V9XCF2_9ACAR|nr:TM2 domain-containing protein [Tropilaelaps mercedesae]